MTGVEIGIITWLIGALGVSFGMAPTADADDSIVEIAAYQIVCLLWPVLIPVLIRRRDLVQGKGDDA